jgi:hypothetical protein
VLVLEHTTEEVTRRPYIQDARQTGEYVHVVAAVERQ